MFRLAIISVLASVASVQCATAPVIGALVAEKTVESHGNSVVHATAPLVAVPALGYTSVALAQRPVAENAQPEEAKAAPHVAEKTFEDPHGHRAAYPLVALAKPLAIVESRVAAVPAIATRGLTYAAPIYYPGLVAEKTVSSYGHSVRHVVA